MQLRSNILIGMALAAFAGGATSAAPPDVAATVGQAGTAQAMPTIDAPIALLVDVGSGRVLYARDVHRRFVPASITKIMTSYVAFDLLSKGRLRLDQRLGVRRQQTLGCVTATSTPPTAGWTKAKLT